MRHRRGRASEIEVKTWNTLEAAFERACHNDSPEVRLMLQPMQAYGGLKRKDPEPSTVEALPALVGSSALALWRGGAAATG